MLLGAVQAEVAFDFALALDFVSLALDVSSKSEPRWPMFPVLHLHTCVARANISRAPARAARTERAACEASAPCIPEHQEGFSGTSEEQPCGEWHVVEIRWARQSMLALNRLKANFKDRTMSAPSI